MNKVFNTQIFRLIIETSADLNTAIGLEVIYKSPDGSIGSWTAMQDPNRRSRMFCDCTALIQIGRWYVYGKALYPEGEITGKGSFFDVINKPF
jgi:hypothetical protein